jgi:hypothetical protein
MVSSWILYPALGEWTPIHFPKDFYAHKLYTYTPCLSLAHMSNRKNPGNTKHVFDGHWLMEIDGNCSKHEVSDGTFPN